MGRVASVQVGKALRLLWVAAVAASAGCASVQLRDVVPQPLVADAHPAGFGNIRLWGDADEDEVPKFIAGDASTVEAKWRTRAVEKGSLVYNILAISGGADDGAFGAGLLNGWAEAGKRPEFDLVTGISAGGLIAPLAFLGRDYDDELASVFTMHDSHQIYEANVLAGLFGGSSLADSGPLKHLIDTYVDHGLMRRVAEERRKGRLLIIGTTNIDAQRPVFWDMGRIAQSDDPEALELFRKVLLASASIPGVFAPVHIKVTAGGKTYEELHVDGGATRQVFLSPGDFSFKTIDKRINRKLDRRLYIIRNGKLGPEWEATKESALDLAARSLSTLTKSQGIGDLVRMYTKAERDGIDYNLTAIPDEFSERRKKPFELTYMRPLYDTGYKIGSGGIPWQKKPPGF